MTELDRGVHVTPGDGIVARIGTYVAHARGDDEGLNQLIVRLNALADAPWPEVVRTITSDIAAAGYSSHPVLACATVEADRVRALVFGDLQLLIATDTDNQVLDGSESSTWIDVAIKGVADRIQCGAQGNSTVVGVLRDGVVPGGGFLLDTRSPIPAAVAWAPIQPDDVDPSTDPGEEEDELDEPLEVVASIQGVEAMASVVDLDRFAERHEASAAAARHGDDVTDAEVVVDTDETATDGSADIRSLHELVSSIDRATTRSYRDERSLFSREENIGRTAERFAEGVARAEPVEAVRTGERASLGTFTFDDGASLQLTRPVVIGRGVPERYMIDGEAATTVLLDDTQGMISSVHLEVRLDGHSVQLTDKQSEAGTFLHSAFTGERVQLDPEVPTTIEPHTTVELGQRTFTYTLPPPPDDDDAS